ncbi:hypothetical protein COV17_02995 [Candidatus Woesearchaeota archaeon CG10_big_fil_rev_8_21_14_0_10_36_11]|nr:MAG: hypothetical protein COV17_02995 [Candidatus Woesearchaeota archaeon CG10_big_fil_rev_8_21_14_0_10_36_11]
MKSINSAHTFFLLLRQKERLFMIDVIQKKFKKFSIIVDKLGPPECIKKISENIWELPTSYKKGMRVLGRI